MRQINGGLILFLLLVLHASLLVTSASAQITGRVEVIGFDGKYRPGCWTPILVRLKSAGSPTDFYELRVWQYDQDRDRPYFSRRVNISAEKGELGFWTYFLPEPIHQGLTQPTSGAPQLMQRLKITVHDKNGKELSQVSLEGATAQSVDHEIFADRVRATRFVVFVGPGAAPALRHYAEPDQIVGLSEDLEYSRVTIDRLPESAIGYEGVDAVVWLDGNPADLKLGGSSRFNALREYVQMGGKLIISTQPSWQQLNAFEELMPVTITGMETNELQSPARELANTMALTRSVPGAPARNPWTGYKTPFSIATAEPRKDAVVDLYADRVSEPVKPSDRTPWLVRMPFGFGSVVWVGQDMGSRETSDKVNWGWPVIWERIFGSASVPQAFPTEADRKNFSSGVNIDLGFALIDGMNLTGRSVALIGVTITFFIVYWLVAGPGSFFFLKYRNRLTLNWFVFGAIALAATGVTMMVVRVMLRGAPQMKHVSLVRVHGDRAVPASVSSRMGIYIPQDGYEHIELGKGDGRYASTLSGFPIHPVIHMRRQGDQYLFPAPRDYRVTVPIGEEANVDVDMPFRTTMKRLRATWVGSIEPRIEGTAKLEPTERGGGYISGTLRNLTGGDLSNVYIAFRHQPEGVEPTLWMMHIPLWPDGAPLDLGTAFNPPANKRLSDISINNPEVRLGDFPVRGTFRDWMERLRSVTTISGAFDYLKPIEDFSSSIRPESVPMLSFFNAFPVIRNDAGVTRGDIHRSGARNWDISGALQAGELVIVARQDNRPLPMTMNIDGDAVPGSGAILYQFVHPLTPLPSAPTPTSQPN